MAYVIAQLSDVHVGGSHPGCEERFSQAIATINAMERQPDLVLLTGDNTEHGTAEEWEEFTRRLAVLRAPWEAIGGNHDRPVTATTGHRAMDAGPLRLVLLDSSDDHFTEDDAAWFDAELSSHAHTDTVVAIHHPPFETGIWWMDCIGLQGAEYFEEVVRRHPQVIKVLSGHMHRTIQTSWGGCSLWVSPSTAVAVAIELAPGHHPAESAEPPAFSLHAYTGRGIVSHVVPVGPSAARSPLGPEAAGFIDRVRSIQRDRPTLFA